LGQDDPRRALIASLSRFKTKAGAGDRTGFFHWSDAHAVNEARAA